MPLIEEISDEEGQSISSGPSSSVQLLDSLRGLISQLCPSEYLLTNYTKDEQPEEGYKTYHDSALYILRQISILIQRSGWTSLSLEEQSEVVLDLARLYGDDLWTSSSITQIIDEITTDLDKPTIAIHLLSNPVRTLFSPSQHPMLNLTTARALSKPAGGSEAHTDFHETSSQLFKVHTSGWGCHNIIKWCCHHLSSSVIENKIGIILPPTLVMMDDWEPHWRARGVSVLASWYKKFPVEMMIRMGLDKLLIKSLIHTLSLHSNPPNKEVLPLTLDMVLMTTETKREERAELLAEVVDKYLIIGWAYNTSARESRVILIDISEGVANLCQVLGTGIARWLKTIIPSLLEPLQYTPSTIVLDHYSSNLSALSAVIFTMSSTGRVPRWRGQIINVLSRLWLQMKDQEMEFEEDPIARGVSRKISTQLKDIFTALAIEYPDVTKDYDQLLQLDPVFQPLIPSSA